MAKQKKLLYQLIISLIFIGCAYVFPLVLGHSEIIACIVAILLTVGVILFISSVKSLTRMH